MRLSLVLCAAVGGLLASAAQAQTQTQAPTQTQTQTIPSPQTPLTEQTVQAWIDQYIKTEGWRLLAADPAAVTFGLAAAPVVGESGLVTTEIRREYFGLWKVGPNGARSLRQTWILDCKARRVWVRRISVFNENNLQGASETREAVNPAWTEISVGSVNDRAMQEICAVAPAKPPG